MFNKKKEPTRRLFNIICPYDCGDHWQYSTSLTKLNIEIHRVCPKCGGKYLVKIVYDDENVQCIKEE